MSEVILRSENISKQYRLGVIGTGTLSHDLNRWWHRLRGKQDPYLQVGELNNQTQLGKNEYVWALKNISFEVEKGEVLGIIGKNGAGKSTLLKILSKVTSPTTGIIRSRGRIASLLEVGTGFHPELTGRENIYLNGAILGMTKLEISSKLEEIIEFSGCQRYIDTPVKRYSSGMKVRLAFAVAAHLEPDILVVDEVLAVGDAEFQKKAIGKMQDISQGNGRTVLFVSHNMAAVQSLCNRCILLKQGAIVANGETQDIISMYLKGQSKTNLQNITERQGNRKILFKSVSVYGNSTDSNSTSGSVLNIAFTFLNPQNISDKEVRMDMRIDSQFGTRISWLSTEVSFKAANSPLENLLITVPKNPLNQGSYHVTLYLTGNGEIYDWIQNAFTFEVKEGDFYNNGKVVPRSQGDILLNYTIQTV
ncbi:ABC transporter ATP-binding protein [Ascidiimonas aurantiaca]|uniref:ABC transporter ATP-binding protein n=1 Tax=Ascidiimonas aurantiaca TaxID=1685432 RepID=UPI0030ECAADF